MKKLSIEEKAKRYDEAIERAKIKRDEYLRLDGPKSHVPQDIENIFPELKESEDEKIRKEIINYFKCQSRDEPARKNIHNKWITWLEKQGEQNPTWSEEDEVGLGDALWVIERARTIALDENEMGNLWYAERWLTSLKKRYTWKPTDEQMVAIKCAALDVSKFSSRSEQLMLENGPYYKALDSLYQDLKKL